MHVHYLFVINVPASGMRYRYVYISRNIIVDNHSYSAFRTSSSALRRHNKFTTGDPKGQKSTSSSSSSSRTTSELPIACLNLVKITSYIYRSYENIVERTPRGILHNATNESSFFRRQGNGKFLFIHARSNNIRVYKNTSN